MIRYRTITFDHVVSVNIIYEILSIPGKNYIKYNVHVIHSFVHFSIETCPYSAVCRNYIYMYVINIVRFFRKVILHEDRMSATKHKEHAVSGLT